MTGPATEPAAVDTPPVGATFAGHVLAAALPSADPRISVVEARAPAGAPVTIELMSAAASTDPGLRRAVARLAARRREIGPPLLPVLAAGMQDGRLYVIRPRPGGTTLADRLDDGPLDPSDAVRLLSEVAGALGGARALGLPVGGLTPHDVLLTGSPAAALLTRYGLGAPGDRACERNVSLENAGYLAPEAARGAPVEPASTVYALACVLVACLTGAPPFAHERPLLTLHAHLTAPPPAVSLRVRGLPREIDEVVAAALAKAPADRPRSPERLMRAVQRALATSAPIPVAAPRARPTGTGATPHARTPARARPERRRPPRRAAPRRRRRVSSWRAALVGAASVAVLSAGFGAGTLAGDVHAAGPAAPPGPTVAERTAAVHRLDLAMARLSTRRTLARARLRGARDARAEAEQAKALADAYAAARRVAAADAPAAGAVPVAAHLATVELAYRRLARAATRHDRRGFAAAAGEVVAAERALDAASRA